MKLFNSTKSNLYLLISLFLIAFISFFIINNFFINLMKSLDNKSKNYQSKIYIGQFISNDIKNIESLFLRLYITSSSKTSRLYIKKKIYDQIDIINNSLSILQNGGILKRVVDLNIQGVSSTVKTITYKKIKNDFALESIDIKPKLFKLKKMISHVQSILDKRDIIIKNNNRKNLVKLHKKITRYYKTTPAFFSRMSENIARLLYEGEIELLELNKTIEKKKDLYNNTRITILLSVVLFVLLFGYIISRKIQKDNDKLKQVKQYTRTILDSQNSLVFVSANEKLEDANKALLEFLHYNNKEELLKEYKCICSFFIKNDEDDSYVYNKDYNGLNWIEYIIENKNLKHKVLMMKDEIYYHFSITVVNNFYGEDNSQQSIVTLSDITNEILINNTLENLVNEKTNELQVLNNNLEEKIKEEVSKSNKIEKKLYESEKMASMGEMIGNIAHQWRQPLSVISVLATGINARIEMDMITQEFITKSCNDININAQYLSKTIDDFKNFIKGDKNKTKFKLIEQVNSFLNIINSSSVQNNINIIVNIDNDLYLNGYENELNQCIINIYNNAKDAFIENNINNRLFIVEAMNENENVVILLKDNAKGIPANILPKIFEPYFTTKHKSQGTGLGLHMTYNLITEGMNGNIQVNNIEYQFDSINYKGACFKITLPKE